MPWTLYRYILWDLLKLLVMTASVLVTVISFAAAIKPLSEGLLGAGSLTKFVAYTSPTMLMFALPFAGAFASTIVFLRLAADNEITAMSASGISYVSILMPVIVLGLVLTTGLFLASNLLIPRFYRAAAQTVERDLMTILVSTLNQNRPYILEGDEYVVYADRAIERAPTPEELEAIAAVEPTTAPDQLILLQGVAVGQMQEDGELRSDTTAKQASIWLFRDDVRSWIRMILTDLVVYDTERGLLRQELLELGPITVPSFFRDSPEFLSLAQLRSLRRAPERFGQIGALKADLADAIAAAKLQASLLERLLEGGSPVVLTAGREQYALSAPGVRVQDPYLHLEPRGRQLVQVQAFVDGEPSRRYEPETVRLAVERSRGARQPTVAAELFNVKVFGREGRELSTQQVRLSLPRLSWPENLLETETDRMNAFELLEAAADSRYARSPIVLQAGLRLWSEIQRLSLKIAAQLHQRAASAVACSLLLLLGAVLSIQLRGQIPLAVYFWSFALAIITIIIIHTGTNLAGSTDFSLGGGLAVLWSGNVLLAVVVGVVYCRMART